MSDTVPNIDLGGDEGVLAGAMQCDGISNVFSYATASEDPLIADGGIVNAAELVCDEMMDAAKVGAVPPQLDHLEEEPDLRILDTPAPALEREVVDLSSDESEEGTYLPRRWVERMDAGETLLFALKPNGKMVERKRGFINFGRVRRVNNLDRSEGPSQPCPRGNPDTPVHQKTKKPARIEKGSATVVSRGRGRPRKYAEKVVRESQMVKRKVGRPRKVNLECKDAEEGEPSTSRIVSTAKRGRGRPRKQSAVNNLSISTLDKDEKKGIGRPRKGVKLECLSN